ncbi:hypothetical protein [Desulfobacula sp.]|uniref:hypothetical protein n=1 Tax=Desulfobacula sp. TaxID=2593537 RepID=UPI001EC595CE|nr:hypothetical protein [Desulfobacula sp.]
MEYNELLSQVALDHKGEFSALASPTLNKQETVTFLYKDVVNQLNGHTRKITKINPVRLRLEFIARLGLMIFRLVKTSLQFRVKTLPKKCVYIRTWLVPRSIQNGIVRDDYFRQLINDLSKNQSVIVGFHPLDYGETLKKFKGSQKPKNFIIPIGLLSILDIIKVLVNYISSAKIKLKNEYFFKGNEISVLINDSLKMDYYKLRSFQAYLELEIAKKIKLFSPRIFLYIFENQAWENAYLSIFKKTETKTIGYQSSGFSFRFLNFFPSKIDCENALYPDKILTVGDNFTKVLIEFGEYPIPVETFGALRFDFPTVNGNYIIEEPTSKIFKRVLYAFPVHFYQYQQIIQDLIDVFQSTEIEVHLKYHPLFQSSVNNIQLPSNFKVWSQDNNKKLNETYDVVLFNDNSFGIESIFMGVKSFEYVFDKYYDETRLICFDIYNAQLDKNKLFILKEQIIFDKFDKTYSNELVKNYISNIYTRYKGLDEYFI